MLAFLDTLLSRRKRPGHKHRSRRRSSVLPFESLERREMMSATPPRVTGVEIGSTAWAPAFVSHLQTNGLGEQGFRIPTGSSAQLTPLPWSNLNQIAITFSQDVGVHSNDLSLTSATSINIEFSDFAYDPQTFVATWTLSSSLPSSAYRIDLDGNGVGKVLGQFTASVLDGEWSDGVSSFATGSGNGVAGGDFEFQFKVLAGDANQSGSVTASDSSSAVAALGLSVGGAGYSALLDIDGSGVISTPDINAIDAALGQLVSTGTPLGSFNDAPSARGISTKKMNDPNANVSVSLFSPFSDAETADASLQFTFTNSRPDLFDSVSFNASTGNLVFNTAAGKSGRAEIIVTATDAGGIEVWETFFVDVDYLNVAPFLMYDLTLSAGDTWFFSGTVSDADDVVDGGYVYFYGALQTRAAVDEDGTWGFAVIVDPADWGFVSAVYKDPHGALSNTVFEYLGF